MEAPVDARLVVRFTGKPLEDAAVIAAFGRFGALQDVQFRDNSVAIITFELASSAAAALEQLDNTTLNDGPRLSIEWASSGPRQSWSSPSRGLQPTLFGCTDSDNSPPRSRLFLVVPKDSDPSILKAELQRFSGCEYVKTDLIASKGICYVKYNRASTAAQVMDGIHANNQMIAHYKVKCMMAEPREKSGSKHGADGGHVRLPDSLDDNALGGTDLRSDSSLSSRSHLRYSASGNSSDVRHGAPAPWLQLAHEALNGAPPEQTRPGGGQPQPETFGGGEAPSGTALASSNFMYYMRSMNGPAYDQGACQRPYTAGASDGFMPPANAAYPRSQPRFPPHAPPPPQPDQPGLPHHDVGPIGSKPFAHATVAGRRPSLAASNGRFSDDGGVSSAIGSSYAADAALGVPPSLVSGGGRANGSTLGGFRGPTASYSAPYGPGGGLVAPAPALHHGSFGGGPYHQPQQPMLGLLPSSAPQYPSTAHCLDVSMAGKSAPELSRQRLYVVVGKSATEEQLTKLFRRFGGMEYCNLKKNKKTGQSKGYCFVNYSTPEAALAAITMLNGVEFPQGSGKHLKVMYSEVLTNRPPSSLHASPQPRVLPPSPPPGAPLPPLRLSDSPSLTDSAMMSRASLFHSHDFTACSSEDSRSNLRASLAAMFSPDDAHSAPHVSDFRAPDSPSVHTSSSGFGGSGNNTPSPPPGPPPGTPPDNSVVYVHITKPLPPYALQYHFETCGKVEHVKLHPQNLCYALVKFSCAEHAENAVKLLNNTKMCGMDLTVERHDGAAGELRRQFASLQVKASSNLTAGPQFSAPADGGDAFAAASAPPGPTDCLPRGAYYRFAQDAHQPHGRFHAPALATMCENFATQ